MSETRWLCELSPGLAVTVVVHTADARVVADVERAATKNGLALQRIDAPLFEVVAERVVEVDL